jgi:hypothetical protein
LLSPQADTQQQAKMSNTLAEVLILCISFDEFWAKIPLFEAKMG